MSWTPPTSESEWEECLSAYVDGELDAESVAGLEAYLVHDVERRAQLEAFRKTSALLTKWHVEAPPSNLGKPTAPRNATAGIWRVAAGFAVGLAVGIVASNGDAPRPKTSTPVADTVSNSPAVSEAAAHAILDTIGASEPVERTFGRNRLGDWSDVRSELERRRRHRSQITATNPTRRAAAAYRTIRNGNGEDRSS